MTATLTQQPRLLHAIPGRVRVHLPAWQGAGRRQLERQLRQLPGVRKVEANQLTGNLLVQFDPRATDQQTVLDAVHALEPEPAAAGDEPSPPPVLEEQEQGAVRRA